MQMLNEDEPCPGLTKKCFFLHPISRLLLGEILAAVSVILFFAN